MFFCHCYILVISFYLSSWDLMDESGEYNVLKWIHMLVCIKLHVFSLTILQVSPEQGQFLAMLVKLMGAERCIEVGIFTVSLHFL